MCHCRGTQCPSTNTLSRVTTPMRMPSKMQTTASAVDVALSRRVRAATCRMSSLQGGEGSYKSGGQLVHAKTEQGSSSLVAAAAARVQAQQMHVRALPQLPQDSRCACMHHRTMSCPNSPWQDKSDESCGRGARHRHGGPHCTE